MSAASQTGAAPAVAKKAPGLLRRLPTSRVAMVGLALILVWVVLALLARSCRWTRRTSRT